MKRVFAAILLHARYRRHLARHVQVLRTVPSKGWFTMLRLYGALEPWFDKKWRPGEITLVR